MGHFTTDYVCHEVSSEAPSQLQKRDFASIERDGLWLTRNDFVPTGGLPDLNVPWISQVFGIPIRIEYKTFLIVHEALQKSLQLLNVDPTIV